MHQAKICQVYTSMIVVMYELGTYSQRDEVHTEHHHWNWRPGTSQNTSWIVYVCRYLEAQVGLMCGNLEALPVDWARYLAQSELLLSASAVLLALHRKQNEMVQKYLVMDVYRDDIAARQDKAFQYMFCLIMDVSILVDEQNWTVVEDKIHSLQLYRPRS